MTIKKFFLGILMYGVLNNLFAATYRCDISRQAMIGQDGKIEAAQQEMIKKRQQSVLIEDESEAFVERCSFLERIGSVTCDRYRIDHVAVDRNINAKKFYLFRAQFDIQLYQNLTFIENNGRGGVTTGKCLMLKP
jgi:hypothetical protein